MQVSGRTELQALHDNLSTFEHDISLIEAPIGDIDDIIGEVLEILEMPKKISGDLKTIITVMKEIKSVSDEAWDIPEIGEFAEGLSTALSPMVEVPPPSGILGEIRSVLNDINDMLEPMIDPIKRVQTPIKNTDSAIKQVELKTHMFIVGTQDLIDEYRDKPPANVEACAKGLNDGIKAAVKAVHDAEDSFSGALSKLEAPLHAIAGTWSEVSSYLKVINDVFKEIDYFTGALRTITGYVKEAEDYGKTKIEMALKGILGKKLERKVKKLISKAQKLIRELKGKIASALFKPVEQQVKKLEGELKSEIGKIPHISTFEQQLQEVESEIDSVRQCLVDTLAGECAKTLGVPT